MIRKSYIESSLKKLNALYNNPKSKNNQEYFSKLAIIECCGWIEDSFDDLMEKYAEKNLKDQKHIDYYHKRVKKNYSFDYDVNIRPLLIMLVGLKKFEKVENKLNKNGDIDKLKGSLGYLKERRDKGAHSHLNVMRSFDAPSVIYSKWMDVYKILKKMENEIKVSH